MNTKPGFAFWALIAITGGYAIRFAAGERNWFTASMLCLGVVVVGVMLTTRKGK